MCHQEILVEGWDKRHPQVLARGPLLRCLPSTSQHPGSLGLGWDPSALPFSGCRDAEVEVKGGYVGQWPVCVCTAWTDGGGSSLDVILIEYLLCVKHGAQGSQTPRRVEVITPFYRGGKWNSAEGPLAKRTYTPDIPCVLLAGRSCTPHPVGHSWPPELTEAQPLLLGEGNWHF